MFGFLKEKLKKAAQIFSKKIEDEGTEVKLVEEIEEIFSLEEPFKKSLGKNEKTSEKKEKIPEKKLKKEKPSQKGKAKKEKKSKDKKKKHIEETDEEIETSEPEIEERKDEKETFEEEIFEEKIETVHEEKPVETKEEKKGWFSRLREKVVEKVTTKKIDDEQFENFFFDLEMALLENNVAFEIIEKIKEDLKREIVEKPLKKNEIEKVIEESLMSTIESVLKESDFDLVKSIKEKTEKPYVILFFGVNGSGKTTTIAKIASYLKKNKLNCVLAAGDTFRAASIEQLEEHGLRLGVKVVKHDYKSDPGAVVFDAIAHAKARRIDCVLVDTAGRQHSNEDLMQEMKKIAKVAKADLKLFVGEAVTGNDCIEQVREFNKAVEIDGIILSKLDIDEKGGAALSVSYVSGKPILFVGTGQKYDDLEKFSKEKILKNLGI